MKETHYFKGLKRIVITVTDFNNSGGKGTDAWPFYKLLLVLANILAFILWPWLMLDGLAMLFCFWVIKKNFIIGAIMTLYLLLPFGESIFAVAVAFYYLWIWKVFKG